MSNVIKAERDSVCMGDDCNAPNAMDLCYEAGERLSDFMVKVAKYVPNMKSTVWSVECMQRVIGFLIFDEAGSYTYELMINDIPVSELPDKKIFCSYYTPSSLYDYSVQPPRDRYPEYDTLLDKVKAHNKNNIDF